MKVMLLAAVLQVVPWVFPEVIVLHRDLRSPDEAVLLPYAISASQPMGVLEVMRYGWVTTFTPIRVGPPVCRGIPLWVFEDVSAYEVRDVNRDGKDDIVVKITTDLTRPTSTRVFYGVDNWTCA